MSTKTSVPGPHPDAVKPNVVAPVKLWAVVGAAVLAFIGYVLVKWVTGPYFKRVPQGPSEPGEVMKVVLNIFQWGSIPLALGFIYWFVVRPWRREGRLSIDGCLVLAFATLWFQDPLSSGAAPWFQYNSYLFNMGSWVNDTPGMAIYGQPGAMLHEPLGFVTGVYVYCDMAAVLVGSWMMRRARARWPHRSSFSLIGICFVGLLAFNVVFEGLMLMPSGVLHYGGGHWPIINADSYAKYPLQEGLLFGITYTALACVRHFVNDRGLSVAERGAEKLRGSVGRITVMRVLAVTGLVHLVFLVTFTMPSALLSTWQPAWPKDVQARSYFLGGLCGLGTDRMCPGPNTPNFRNGGIYVSPTGQAVVPPDLRPEPVPFIQTHE